LFKDSLETVALFGGSFDPPHFGHKMVVEEALKSLSIDKLIIVPTFLNPFKTQSYSTPSLRLKMAKEMFQEFPKVEVSDYEIEEKKPTPTVQTVQYFQQKYNVQYVIVGADNLNAIDRWYNFKWLNEQVTWVIASRVGYTIASDKLRDFKILDVVADISSTQIRNQNK